MGYELHITRAEHWTESEITPIALEEWITYLSLDDEMRHDQFAEAATAAGDKVRVESPGLAVWTTCASTAEDDSAWFDWRGGAITVKNPDDSVIRKMCEIAVALTARVQGDDGEWYCADHGSGETAAPEQRPFWRRLFG